MDGLPLNAKILKSLIAPAKYSAGSTLFFVCQVENQCCVYEQLLDGTCRAWPVPVSGGVQQAECMIHRQEG